MPLTAIIVSRDRPAQLDLLLRSVTCHADDLFDSVSVIWSASDMIFTTGYGLCAADHASVNFSQESHFRSEVSWNVLDADEYVTFLTDDSYFYRDLPEVDPCAVLAAESEALCFSLRLGRNTNTCYPLKGRYQEAPEFIDGGGYLMWEWAKGDADFGYPGSLDGHIFRRNDLMNFIESDDGWWNPNTLEDVLCRSIYRTSRKYMASFERSVLVGVPANRTSESHTGNRFGEKHFVDHGWLNYQYVNGGRIMFPDVHRDAITGAHQELSLEIM